MPKQRVQKNQNGDEQEKLQQQKQHVGKEQQQSTSTNELQLQQPPKKITHTAKKGGQPKEYLYLMTVKSSEELDNVRFENYCQWADTRRIHTFTAITLPCTRKTSGKQCDYELRALRSADGGRIYIYAYSQHNHQFESNERRLSKINEERLPDGNPPPNFRTLDTIKWTFLQTLPHYDTLDKLRRKNNCHWRSDTSDRNTRIRYYCTRKCKCKFMLLAVKTTKQRYHVYRYGEHNHSVHKIKKIQTSTRGKQKSRQMDDEGEDKEVTMEEEQEQEDEAKREQHTEEVAQREQDEQMETEGGEYPLEKCQRRLASNLRKDNMERTKKWMNRIDQAEIGRVIAEMDVENVAKLMSMANTDIGNSEETLDFWLPWIKKALRKREAELIEFITKFKDLRKIESLPMKLKAKIRKMLKQRRQKIENKETEDDDDPYP